MYILGINAYHADASACLIKDGKVLFAIEEERLNRIKHWSGLPVRAIKLCLDDAGISMSDVNHITVSKDPKARFFDKILYAIRNPGLFLSVKNRAENALKVQSVLKDIYNELSIGGVLSSAPTVHFIEHHRAHNASAFYASPFEESALLSIDGMGDFTSTMLGYGKGTKMSVQDTISYPHSLGYLYMAMTQFLGFRNLGDEYKVMGLAAYGSATFYPQLKEIIDIKPDGLFELKSEYFSHFRHGVKMTWENGVPSVDSLYTPQWQTKFGPIRRQNESIEEHHKDLAASLQLITEEAIFSLCETVHKKTKSRNLCLSGGVAQNSVVNGKIIDNTPFKNLYVPPASHDAGTAIGSALYFYHHIRGKARGVNFHNPYTGARYLNEEIKSLLDKRGIPFIEYEEDNICEHAAQALIDRKVIGWFQGRTEFGPRALGNRSILVDPTRLDAKDLLNIKIKRREDFRPFATSILKERAEDFFDHAHDANYMERVFHVKKEKRHLIPAVVHTDGTGRVQTVNKDLNPKFHNLIDSFYKKTQIPLLLNTSFNENEPIVNAPEYALDCFLRTDMDILVLENILVNKS